MMPWPEFDAEQRIVTAGSRLYVYSDGAHEIQCADGSQWPYDEFLGYMSQRPTGDVSIMDRLLAHVRLLHGSDTLDDDFSFLEVKF